MNGTEDAPDRSTSRKRDNHPDNQRPNPELKHSAFKPAHELGKQLAKGVAFSSGKHLADDAIGHIKNNPDDNFFTHLLDWIQSL